MEEPYRGLEEVEAGVKNTMKRKKMAGDQPTRKDYQQMRQVLKDLGFWAHKHRAGWTIRSGPCRDTAPFPGLYLNKYQGRVYVTQKPIDGCIKWPHGKPPDPDLWVELDPIAVGSLQRRGGRRNYAPRNGMEREAVWEFLNGGRPWEGT